MVVLVVIDDPEICSVIEVVAVRVPLLPVTVNV